MNEVDFSRPDRQVGSMLSGDQIERLREAIGWLRGQRGIRLKDIAIGCDASGLENTGRQRTPSKRHPVENQGRENDRESCQSLWRLRVAAQLQHTRPNFALAYRPCSPDTPADIPRCQTSSHCTSL